jgi:hypothetical protein
MLKITSGLWDVLRGYFKVFSSLLKGDWKGVWKGLTMIFRGWGKIFMGMVQGLWNTVVFAFKNLGVIVGKVFSGMWEGLKTLARNGAGWLVDQIKRIPSRIMGLGRLYVDAGKWLMGKFFEGLQKLGDIGVSIGKSLLNGIIGAINFGIRAINDMIPDSIGFSVAGKDIGFNLPNDPFPTIPELARGGIVKARPGGTLALIGEGGHDEAVVPLSGPHARGRMSGGDTHIHIHNVLDSMGAAREVEKMLIKLNRATGRPLQFTTT